VPWQAGNIAVTEAAPSRPCVTSEGGTMTLQARLESLKDRHASLETRISDEDHRPRPDLATLSQLKVKKLRLKEEMERLQESP
jgi:hypothetical protein